MLGGTTSVGDLKGHGRLARTSYNFRGWMRTTSTKLMSSFVTLHRLVAAYLLPDVVENVPRAELHDVARVFTREQVFL